MDKQKIIIEISKKILLDFRREYFEDSFDIRSPKELKDLGDYNYTFDIWKIFINVPDEQFGGKSPFSINFKDETMEPFSFQDGGAPGRTSELKIIKKNGKYAIGDIGNNE